CLFGVDINPKSVAICRLRLWIELLKNAYYTTPQPPPCTSEGGGALSSPPYKGGVRGGWVLETLPNIDINIKCGNSLISRFSLNDDITGLAHYAPVERKRLKELTKRYKEKVWLYKLGEKGPSNKGILRHEIEAIKEQWRTFSLPSDFYMKSLLNVKNELAQAVFVFDEVGHQKREKLHQRAAELEEKIYARQQTVYANAFEWRFEFPEVLDDEGAFTGFDVVIGNPPYGIKFKKIGLSECIGRYPDAERVPDSYCFFMLLSLNILRHAGIQSLIVPNTFCDLENGEVFRKAFLREYELQWIWQTGWAFDSAVVDTLVFQVDNRKSADNSVIKIQLEEQKYTRQRSDFLSNRLAKIDYRNQPGKNDLAQRIRNHSVLLGQITDVKAGVKMYEKGKGKPPQTEETIASRPYSITGDCPEGWKPLYRGTDVTRYTLNLPSEFVHYGPWLAAPRSCELFNSPKLLMRRTDDRLMCSIELMSAICVNSCHVIKQKPDLVPQFSYEFLMAVLNSRLTQYYFELTNPQMKGKVFAEIKVVYVENLPIPNAITEQQKPVTDLVDQILAAKKADAKADTTDLEKRIDELVYQLYGLTDEEIEVVEGK
ncbi:MAG: TaqI-like C-terminal specificity domain-containing protein, partial [Deltaproteobacteria bacterium]